MASQSLGGLEVGPAIPDRTLSIPPVLRSGFRPFYLAGAAFGLLVMSIWLGSFVDLSNGLLAVYSQRAWHGHEMVYGFGGAMCGGLLLTAIPSWAGTPEVMGRRLAVLVAAWGIGRVAMLLSPLIAPEVTSIADLLYFPLLTLFIAPGVWRARNRYYRWALPVLAAFSGGNILFHCASIAHVEFGADLGVRVGYYSLMMLYCIVAGLLTPIFTQAWLEEKGRATTAIPIRSSLEWSAILSVLCLAIADVADMPKPIVALLAAVATIINILRMLRWQTSKILSSALMLPMHVGYLAFLISLILCAISALYWPDGVSPAIHAFTIGAWGLTKFSLITRVSLKHTGRPLVVPASMTIAFVGIGLAAIIRVVASFGVRPEILLPLAAILWMAPLAIYLSVYGLILLRPSLPREHHPDVSSR